MVWHRTGGRRWCSTGTKASYHSLFSRTLPSTQVHLVEKLCGGDLAQTLAHTATSVKQRPCTLNCSLIVDFESLRNRCRIAKGTPEGGSIEHGPYTRLHPSADWTRGRRRPATRCDLQQRGLRRTPKSDAAFLWSSIAPRFTSRINTGYANQALSC